MTKFCTLTTKQDGQSAIAQSEIFLTTSLNAKLSDSAVANSRNKLH